MQLVDRIVSVRIPAEEFVAIRGAALAEGKALSEWIREVAVERALEPAEPRRSEDES